jgi:DNA replication ATP-dependent helicase Dna2
MKRSVKAGRIHKSIPLMKGQVLRVEDETSKLSKTITLRQSWFDTHCTEGAFVHVVGQFSATGQITIDDAENLIIVHPDHLVSATAVADSFDCLRKAVLQDRVKATSPTSKPTVYGSILHEVFQEAMKENRWDIEWLDELVQRTVVKFVEGLFEAGAVDTVEALEFLRSKLPELQSWAGTFVAAEPGVSLTTVYGSLLD